MYNRTQMTADNALIIKNLNNVAVEYYELGLQDLSYQIWDQLYHETQSRSNYYNGLLPVISCNMGNMLRQTGYYEEAYRICRQGLKNCFGTGIIHAVPELILQLSILCLKMGNISESESLYLLSRLMFRWSRQVNMSQELEELIDQDFLLNC